MLLAKTGLVFRDCFVANAPRNDGEVCRVLLRTGADAPAYPTLLAKTEWVFRDCFVAGAPRNDGEVCRVLLRTGADAPAYPTLLAKTEGFLRLPRRLRLLAKTGGGFPRRIHGLMFGS